MRSTRITLATGAHLAVSAVQDGRARLEVTPKGEPALAFELTEGEVVMAIEALVAVYAGLCGARADSLTRGVNRTLTNRTAAARQRRAAAAK
jgi:hypothetical protein